MPASVAKIFNVFEIMSLHTIKWCTNIDSREPGIYIVSLSKNPEWLSNTPITPHFNRNVIKRWIETVPNFRIDSEPPSVQSIEKRLKEFWLPDESILYIGKAPKRKNGDALGNRISEYYETKIGLGSPHSGGQWLKTLSNLSDLYLHYGISNNPSSIEVEMFRYFMDNVAEFTRRQLRDSSLPLPFANIRFTPGRDKNTGMKNQRL